jgi:hypothetical protein
LKADGLEEFEVSVVPLPRDDSIERPESLRYLEAELEFLLGRVRSTGQRRVALLAVALRSLRPHPPTEALRDFWHGAALGFDEVKQAALSHSGLLLAAEVSDSTAAAALRDRLSATLGEVVAFPASWRGVVDLSLVDPWRTAFETLQAHDAALNDTHGAGVPAAVNVLADHAAPRRLRDLIRSLIDRAETTVPAADAALAVSEMASHLVLQSRPEFIRLDVRVEAGTVWMQVHARCQQPPKKGRADPECSNILVRRLAHRTGESRTPSRHRIWCELRS